MNLTLAIALALQWAREQAQNEVFTAFFFRFRAGGFALGVCRGQVRQTPRDRFPHQRVSRGLPGKGLNL